MPDCHLNSEKVSGVLGDGTGMQIHEGCLSPPEDFADPRPRLRHERYEMALDLAARLATEWDDAQPILASAKKRSSNPKVIDDGLRAVSQSAEPRLSHALEVMRPSGGAGRVEDPELLAIEDHRTGRQRSPELLKHRRHFPESRP